MSMSNVRKLDKKLSIRYKFLLAFGYHCLKCIFFTFKARVNSESIDLELTRAMKVKTRDTNMNYIACSESKE